MLGWPIEDEVGWDHRYADGLALDMTLPYNKNQKEEGPAGVSPMAAPMPKSVSF